MLPTLFSIGPLTIHSYSVLLDIAILAGVYVVYKEGVRRGISENTLVDLSLITVATGIIFARIYYVIFHLSEYDSNPIRVLYLWEGGLSFHGALIGGAVAASIFVAKHHLGLAKGLDIVVLGAILGQGIGKIGCVMEGCCYGQEASGPFAFFLPDLYGHYADRYPTQIAESIADFVIFGILWMTRRNKPFEGFLTALYLILYGLSRYALEFFRAESDYFGAFRVPQIVGLVACLLGVAVIVISLRKRQAVAAKIAR